MQTSTSSISKNVMRRVRIIHAMRPLISSTALGAVILLLALWGVGREVWVARVFQNMPSVGDVNALLRFFASAFVNTRFAVQVLLILAGGAFVVLLRDLGRNLSHLYSGRVA